MFGTLCDGTKAGAYMKRLNKVRASTRRKLEAAAAAAVDEPAA